MGSYFKSIDRKTAHIAECTSQPPSVGSEQEGRSVMEFDLLIKNGRVVDGSGAPEFRADVAVSNVKIVGVGRFNERATRTID